MVKSTSTGSRPVQEHRIAGALSKDKNILAIYKLEKEYKTGVRSKPLDPLGVPYTDPLIDVHIIAAQALTPEVKKIIEHEPWNANKDKSPIIAEYRQLGKILNYSTIFLASAASLSLQMNCTVEEAEASLKAFFSPPDGFYGLDAWLKAIGTVGEEKRWTQTALGACIFGHETNAKGLDSATRRKIVNSKIQGTAAEMSKLALIRAHRKITNLNDKYRNVVRGREGYITSIIHDECNCIVPGDIYMIPEIDQKTGYRIYVPKLDLNIGEHALAFEYGEAVRSSMEEAMAYVFEKFCDSDLPASSSLSLGRLWIH